MDLKDKKILNLALTLNCDSQCKHCYIDSSEGGNSEDLSMEAWKEVFNFFYKNSGVEISIHGGEPLLYQGIDDLLLYGHKLDLGTNIISNLIHLSDRMIKVFQKTSTYVLTSLDGPEENYSSLRGTNNFRLVINNVEKLIDANIKVHPIYIVHKKNFTDLSWIVNFSLTHKIPVVTLSPIQPIGRAKNLAEYLLTDDELCLVINKIKELNDIYQDKIKFVTQGLYRPEDINQYLKDEDKLKNFNDIYLNVLNDGSIIADFDLPEQKKYMLGNITGEEPAIDRTVYSKYKRLLDKAYNNGLEKLYKGKAINWQEEIQKITQGGN